MLRLGTLGRIVRSDQVAIRVRREDSHLRLSDRLSPLQRLSQFWLAHRVQHDLDARSLETEAARAEGTNLARECWQLRATLHARTDTSYIQTRAQGYKGPPRAHATLPLITGGERCRQTACQPSRSRASSVDTFPPARCRAEWRGVTQNAVSALKYFGAGHASG